MLTILILLLVLALICGAPLFSVMLGGAALGAYAGSGRPFDAEFDGMIASMFGVGTGDQAQVLSTLPLFVYVGYLLAESKAGDRLVRLGNAMVGWLPGGLGIVAIFSSALFTVFTGGSGVTIIALGGVLLPGLLRQGYPERFSLGLIAGTGSVGLLFPPAVPLVIFGTVYGLTNLDPENWNSERFMFAGIVPGIVVLTILSLMTVVVALKRKLPTQAFSLAEVRASLIPALPELVIPFGVIVAIGGGYFALPEVAALTVLYTVVLELATKQLRFRQTWELSRESMAMVGAIFIILFASTAMTNYLATAKVPAALVAWTQAHVGSKVVFLLALNGILLLVGTVMDVFSAIVIVVPLIAPIAKAYGIDPYHLGIIFLLNLEVGYLHPPVGLNLFITSVKFQRPVTEVMWATLPFLGAMIVSLGIITYVPALTVVPAPERRGTAANLVTIVHEASEAQRSIQAITLVNARGQALTAAGGTPLVIPLATCDRLTAAAQDACKNAFFEVTECKRKPVAEEPACTTAAVSTWAAAALDELGVAKLPTVTLVNDAGKPYTNAQGQPEVRELARCAPDASDDCGELFSEATRCHILATTDEEATACVIEKTAEWYSANLAED